jgi:hypothetical protein
MAGPATTTGNKPHQAEAGKQLLLLFERSTPSV